MQNIPLTSCGDGRYRASQSFVGPVKAKTANFTIPDNDTDETFTYSNRGAAGAVQFTLPKPRQGRIVRVLKVAAQNIVLLATNGAKINGGTVNKKYSNTTAGDAGIGTCTIIADGTDWFVTDEKGVWSNDNS